jgi:hypothetical protein
MGGAGGLFVELIGTGGLAFRNALSWFIIAVITGIGTPMSLSCSMLLADRLNNDWDPFTKDNRTSLPMPAFDNCTTSATFGGKVVVAEAGLGGGTDVTVEDEGVGVTVLCAFAEANGSTIAATSPSRFK